MKHFLKVFGAIAIILGLALNSFVARASASPSSDLTQRPQVGKLSPTYEYCFNRWQPDYVKSVQKEDWFDGRGVILAWSKCLGSKFLSVCSDEIQEFGKTVNPNSGLGYIRFWKNYYDDFNACAKKALTTYPPCQAKAINLKKPLVSGTPKFSFYLTASGGKWKGATGPNEPEFTWFRNGKPVRTGQDSYQLTTKDAGQLIQVRETGYSCGLKIKTFVFSKAIRISKSIALKNMPINPSGPILAKCFYPGMDYSGTGACYEVVFPKWYKSNWAPPGLGVECIRDDWRWVLSSGQVIGTQPRLFASEIPEEFRSANGVTVGFQMTFQYSGYKPFTKSIPNVSIPSDWFLSPE